MICIVTARFRVESDLHAMWTDLSCLLGGKKEKLLFRLRSRSSSRSRKCLHPLVYHSVNRSVQQIYAYIIFNYGKILLQRLRSLRWLRWFRWLRKLSLVRKIKKVNVIKKVRYIK